MYFIIIFDFVLISNEINYYFYEIGKGRMFIKWFILNNDI